MKPGCVALYTPPAPRSQSATIHVAEIAHVDRLDPALGRSRREHLAATRDAVRPVGEAARGVVWARDEPGANDERASVEGLDGRLSRRAP